MINDVRNIGNTYFDVLNKTILINVKRVGDALKYNSDRLNYQNQPRGYRDIVICSFHSSNMSNKSKFSGTGEFEVTSQKWPYTIIAPGLTLKTTGFISPTVYYNRI